MFKLGNMINMARFYKSEYISNEDGTGKNEYKLVGMLACSVRDISTMLEREARQESVKKTLKISTFYSKGVTADLFVSIDKEDAKYKIVNVENKDGLNRELIITLELI